MWMVVSAPRAGLLCAQAGTDPFARLVWKPLGKGLWQIACERAQHPHLTLRCTASRAKGKVQPELAALPRGSRAIQLP